MMSSDILGVVVSHLIPLRRDDWVEIAGKELFRHESSYKNICGVKIGDIKKFFGNNAVNDTVWENDDSKTRDYAVYLLVR